MSHFADHDCLLLVQEDDLIKQFIDTGPFISLRRKFRSSCMINRAHPSTEKYFMSISDCRNEEIRHLILNYHTIHPFSMLNLYWEFFMFLLFSCQFILIPVDASFRIQLINWNVYLAKFVVDLIQISDIMKLFFTGYYNPEKSKVVLKRSKIARHYLSTFFLFDIISSTYSYMYPFEMIYSSIPRNILSLTRLLNRIKIVRMSRWLDALELFRQFMGYSSYLFKAIRVALIFLLITFWAFSIIFFIKNYARIFVLGDIRPMTDEELISYSCNNYHAATLMFLVVHIEGRTFRIIAQFACIIFFVWFGFSVQMFLHAQILQVWNKYVSGESKHHSIHEQFKEYMRYKELPVALRERIFAYFEFKFHNQFFKESDINSMVSPLLRQEILQHIIVNHIDKVDFFKYLPQNLLIKIVAQLRSEIYLPGDVIINAGSYGNCMFFIYHGTVAVYTPLGKEICHLEDGAHFGEIALIFNEARITSVVAVTACELLILKRSDFLETIQPFPQFKKNLLTLATERMKKTILQS